MSYSYGDVSALNRTCVLFQRKATKHKYVEQKTKNKKKKKKKKKETSHVHLYIQCKSSLNWNDALQFLFYIEIQKNIQSSENECHDKSCNSQVYRSVWIEEGSKFENAIWRCPLKARRSLHILTHTRIYFLSEILSDTIRKQNVQIIASHSLKHIARNIALQAF